MTLITFVKTLISVSEVVEQALEIVLPILITGAVAFITWIVNKIKTTYSNNTLISNLSDTINSIVLEVYQTYVEALKKSGDFTLENQQTALTTALNKVKSILTTKQLKYLNSEYGDNVDTYLITLIESAVANHKTNITTTTTNSSDVVLIENVETPVSAYEELTEETTPVDSATEEPTTTEAEATETTSEVVADDNTNTTT